LTRPIPTLPRVRHITPERLAELSPLLERLRRIDGLTEKRPGGFSVKSRAFLHFHEDPAGLFADVRLDGADFTRMRVSDPEEQDALVAAVEAALA
jgi:hypothetical protein